MKEENSIYFNIKILQDFFPNLFQDFQYLYNQIKKTGKNILNKSHDVKKHKKGIVKEQTAHTKNKSQEWV